MKQLLNFILDNLIGEKNYTLEENSDAGYSSFDIKTNKDYIGIIIGKEGRIIKSIRNILKVKATLEKKGVNVNVSEAS